MTALLRNLALRTGYPRNQILDILCYSMCVEVEVPIQPKGKIMTDTLIEIDGIEYRRTTGEGGRVVLIAAADLYDRDVYEWVSMWTEDAGTDDFQTWLSKRLVYPSQATDDVDVCAHCGDWDLRDDLCSVATGDVVCFSCRDSKYTFCEDCEEYVRDHDTSTIDSGYRTVCSGCLSNYGWCDRCEEHYSHDNSDHYHTDASTECCAAPAQEFRFGNLISEDPDIVEVGVANDDTAEVTLPSGMITDEGLYLVANYLRTIANNAEPGSWEGHGSHPAWLLSLGLAEIGNEWQRKDGNFTKRLSKAAYKNLSGYKIPPGDLAKIGDIARAHSSGSSLTVTVTRDLNMDAGEYAHEDSCWWESYSYSRCTLKNNGGLALRSFDSRGWVTGRSWVIPLKKQEDGSLTSTFNTIDPVAYLVFNGYGELDGYTGARVVAAMTGLSYRKIVIGGASNMYINSGSGYIVSTEDIIAELNGSLELDLDQHPGLYSHETYVGSH